MYKLDNLYKMDKFIEKAKTTQKWLKKIEKSEQTYNKRLS